MKAKYIHIDKLYLAFSLSDYKMGFSYFIGLIFSLIFDSTVLRLFNKHDKMTRRKRKKEENHQRKKRRKKSVLIPKHLTDLHRIRELRCM